MALLKEESYTIEDIYALPDGERAERIDGHIYYMAQMCIRDRNEPRINRLAASPVEFP